MGLKNFRINAIKDSGFENFISLGCFDIVDLKRSCMLTGFGAETIRLRGKFLRVVNIGLGSL